MKYFRLVFDILLKNDFRKTVKGKRQISQYLIIGIAMLPLVVLICTMLSVLSVVAAKKGIFQDTIALVISASQLLAFFFAIQGILSSLYYADDNEFLSSLPIKPTTIYFAKISVIYITELIISAYTLLPTLLTMAISVAIKGFAINQAFYPLILIIVLFAPILPLAVATILSMPIMFVSKYFKKRSIVGTIATIIMYGALSAGYFAILPRITDMTETIEISDTAVSTIQTIADIIYPNKAMTYAFLGIDTLKNIFITVGIYVGLFVIIILLTKFLYQKAMMAQLETEKSTSPKIIFKKKTHFQSLIERDFKSLVRYPGLALSSFINVILAPILLVVMFSYSDSDDYYSILLSSEDDGVVIVELVQIGIAFLYSILFNVGMNYSAGLAFSRDGKAYYVMKNLPIKPKEIIFEKKFFADSVSLVGIIPLMIVIGVVLKMHIANIFMFGLIMFVYAFGINAFSIYMDMKHPNFDWKDTSEISNTNFYILIPFLLCIFVAIVVLILACVFSATQELFGIIGSYALFWGINGVISIVFAVLFNYLLFTKGEKLYNKMDENKRIVKKVKSIKSQKGFLN